jgi:hypothetical protein
VSIHDSEATFKEGAVFDGRYRIESPLGAGGMGAVYRAFDLKLERRVALKIPHFDARAHPDLIKRFQREARIAAAFDHPNLCPVFDFNRAGEIHYLTMPFIEGRPLTTLLEAGPIDPRQAAKIIRTLALALQQAHERGVIHRDLKPANIMISHDGKLVVMDFGIARFATPTDSLRTRPGTLMGTPAYMAPEQVQGQGQAITAATDVYCLGVIYYQLLTGRLPFIGHPNWVCVQVLHDEPATPTTLRPELDPGLEAICLKAMRKSPQDRYASMAEMAAALEKALASSEPRLRLPGPTDELGEPVEPLPTAASTWSGLCLSAAPAARRKAPMREALVLAVLLVTSGLLWFCYGVESAPPALAPERSTRVAPLRARPVVASPAVTPAAAVRGAESVEASETAPAERERIPVASDPPALRGVPVLPAKQDPQGELTGLRAELRDAYRGAECNHPNDERRRLWNEIHAIQSGLDEPVTTILIKIRKSKSNVPLVLYCDDRNERRRELRLFPGTVEVLAPVMPVTLTYVLHPPHHGGDSPRPAGHPEHLAGALPFLGAFPPPHLGGPPLPSGPPPVPARRIDLKNRELVIEFEFSQATARWKHHIAASPTVWSGVTIRLDDDGRAVAKHLGGGGGLGADVGGVVRHADDGVGADLAGVFDHRLEGLLARLFAHFRVRPDPAADHALQAADDPLRNRRRPHRDAAHQASVLDHAVPLDRERCRHHDPVFRQHSEDPPTLFLAATSTRSFTRSHKARLPSRLRVATY